MKKKGNKLKSRRIAIGIAGLFIIAAIGIGLAAFIGQKREPEQSQENQTVILWTMRASSQLSQCVSNFNKGDYGYRVMLHSCYDVEQNVSQEDALLSMQMALSRSEGPDIMLVGFLDVDALAEQEMLEDLTPYFAKSKRVNQEDYLENVIAAYTYDGKLLALPRWISIETLWGRADIVGDSPGWTVQEMLSLADRYPDYSVTGQLLRWEFRDICMNFVPETFWLDQNGKAREELKMMIEQAVSYPLQIDRSQSKEQYLQVCREEALLTKQDMYKLETLLYFYELAGDEEMVPIGYPTLDATPTALFNPADGLYAIPANAANKKGAWTFLELFFAGELDPEESNNLFGTASGIPVCRKEWEPVLQEALQCWERIYHKEWNEEELDVIEKWLDEITAMADIYPVSAKQFRAIIEEESEPYYEGDKTLEEVLQVIEGRGKLYFQENGNYFGE